LESSLEPLEQGTPRKQKDAKTKRVLLFQQQRFEAHSYSKDELPNRRLEYNLASCNRLEPAEHLALTRSAQRTGEEASCNGQAGEHARDSRIQSAEAHDDKEEAADFSQRWYRWHGKRTLTVSELTWSYWQEEQAASPSSYRQGLERAQTQTFGHVLETETLGTPCKLAFARDASHNHRQGERALRAMRGHETELRDSRSRSLQRQEVIRAPREPPSHHTRDRSQEHRSQETFHTKCRSGHSREAASSHQDL